jgi:crotonobetainyl-CoA:carnitine CoA-transferase CaiB-like acyl-CoA transferase
MTALDGVRVVDTTSSIAGAVATMFLADFGADVVKIEPEAGDPMRSNPGFAVWNRNKRSIIDAPDKRSRLEAAADISVTDTAKAPTPHPDNPALIQLHLPPYTDRVPWVSGRESDQLLAAITGVSLRQASFEGGPVDSIYPHLVTVQGIWAAATAVAALVERQHSGLGQLVTVGGIHGVMVASAGAFTFDTSAPAANPRRPGGPGGSVPFYRTYRCGDGKWLFLAALTPQFTSLAFQALELTDLLNDERLEGRGRAAMLHPDHAPWVIETIAATFATKSRDEWLTLLAKAGCPAGALLDRDDWLDHPQLDAIGMRVEIDDPERGRVVMPGLPIRLADSPADVRTAAPTVGQHNDHDIAWAARPERRPQDEEERDNGPLEGLRVLDLGAIIAGPFAASLLAELGADVIKVEPPSGDSFRGPGFAAYNKGQRGIVLDLRDANDKETFLRLVRTADVVIDNYRPGVLGRLGIGYEQLRDVNDGIITLSITGFGDGGPLGNEAGFDPVLQAMSGMMTAQGGDDHPVFFTVPVNDVAAAATTALAACLALFHREHTGEGQRGWTSLAAMSALLQAGELVRWPGRSPARRGGRDYVGPSADDCYKRDGDGWVRVQGQSRAPARRTLELAEDEELFEYGVLHRDPRPGRETWVTAGRYAHFSRTERKDTLVAPALGEHTEELLNSIALAR